MALVSCLAVFIHFGKQPFPIVNSSDKWTEKVQIFFAMGSLALYADMGVGVKISEISQSWGNAWKLE